MIAENVLYYTERQISDSGRQDMGQEVRENGVEIAGLNVPGTTRSQERNAQNQVPLKV